VTKVLVNGNLRKRRARRASRRGRDARAYRGLGMTHAVARIAAANSTAGTEASSVVVWEFSWVLFLFCS
jgi:hypothetical protein